MLRRQLSELALEEVEPEALWQLAETHGYEVEVGWSQASTAASLEVRLLDRTHEPRMVAVSAKPVASIGSWSGYANDPLEGSFRQQLIPQLREYLKSRLPEYMVPSAWMALKQLPLTPNGKLDRRALPAPQSRPQEMGEYVAPRSELERTLAHIWAQVLRVDQVGVHDNFFELGGHSLLATQVLVRLQAALSLDISTRSLFELPPSSSSRPHRCAA